ncbi:MAG TPA: ThiF family adenylyltransferase [Pyrinomonadaceae bacterium]|nr:ThiF family adenylyltransferase [Pyrinomonadaceae bacterium]
MKKNIRIKTYLHILHQEQTVNFIKTLEEGIKLPASDFSNALIQCLCSANTEKDVLQNFSFKFNIPDEAAKQLLQKLIEKGVVEYYTEQNPAELYRYHRQLLLFDCMQPKREFEENYLHQQKLKQNHVLILGIGGIGNFMATALAVAGVGKITIADFDVVEETNLNRQILFLEKDLGKSKAEAAAKRLKELNSRSKINYLNTEVHSKDEMEILFRKGNVGSFGDDVLKIGMTRRLDPLDRVRELGDASVPFEFDVHAMIRCDDAPALERQLQRSFLDCQINKVNPRKEFFRVALARVKAEVETRGLQVSWTLAAAAREWRESQALDEKIRNDAAARADWARGQIAQQERAELEELRAGGEEVEAAQ